MRIFAHISRHRRPLEISYHIVRLLLLPVNAAETLISYSCASLTFSIIELTDKSCSALPALQCSINHCHTSIARCHAQGDTITGPSLLLHSRLALAHNSVGHSYTAKREFFLKVYMLVLLQTNQTTIKVNPS